MVPAVAVLVAAAAIALPGEVTEFRPGETLEFGQRADETRSFRTRLEAGQAYLLEVDQSDLDVIVEIIAPDGTRRSFDAPLLRYGPERLLMESSASGTFTVSLSSREYKGGSARVALQLRELASNRAADPLRFEALAAETSAAEYAHAGGAENLKLALDAYRSAATAWSDLGAASAEGRARLAAAWLLYWHFSDWQGAAREAQMAADLYEAQGDRRRLAAAIHVQGAALIESAEFDQALALLGTASEARHALGDTYEYARTVNDIGLAYATMGAWTEARNHFREAAELLRASEEWAEELKATANVAVVDYNEGDLGQALQGYQRTLNLLRPGELPAWRAELLDNMAAANRALGNVDAALADYARALAIHEEQESLIHRGRSLSGIGVTYYGIGELERAREYLEQALPLRREAQDRPGQVSTLLFLGSVFLQQGEIDRAIDAHREAVELSVSPRERARAQVMLGRDLAAAGRNTASLDMLAIARETAGEAGTPVVAADARLARGSLMIDLGRPAAAEAELLQALEIYRELGWLTGEAKALFQRARAARATGDLQRASELAMASIQSTEQLRSLIVSPELRASFLATQREPYSLYIDMAMGMASVSTAEQREAWLGSALAVSERARTRAMLDHIQEATAGMLRAAEPRLAERRRELYQQLAGLRFRQSRLLERQRDPAVLAEARTALERTETELQVLESELRSADPRQGALTAPEPLDAVGIRAELDDESMLLQYELGEKRSWLFVVTTDAVAAHPLPPRTELEGMVRRTYELLKTLDRSPSVHRERNELLARLSVLLLEPARPLRPRLVLALDGALHYLPFAVLPLIEPGVEIQPVIARHELVNVPSISVVATQRRLLAGRPRPSMTVAVFADPVFEMDDPRLAKPGGVARTDGATAMPDYPRTGMWPSESLRRLPATELEADAIATLVPSEQRLVATGIAASRATVMNAGLTEFRILHFATHALIDDRYPALSALALSSFDEGRQDIEPYLRLHDVYDFELAADLVTLSACETALGRELRGEGLLGLTRAFLHAGASSVVASLWQVPDRATAELMRTFYERQFQDGLSPATALRQAQLAVSAERRWSDPYYWASFVAHGEWRFPAGAVEVASR